MSMIWRHAGSSGPVGIILSLLHITSGVLRDKFESDATVNQRFDSDVYWQDVEKGIRTVEQLKKRQSGAYLTTKPQPKSASTFDSERYEHDKALYGEEIARIWKKNGSYNYIRKFK